MLPVIKKDEFFTYPRATLIMLYFSRVGMYTKSLSQWCDMH